MPTAGTSSYIYGPGACPSSLPLTSSTGAVTGTYTSAARWDADLAVLTP